MPSFLQGLGLLANVAGGALEGYGLDKRRRVEEALEAAKEKRDKEAADLMRRVQEQSLATSQQAQRLGAYGAGFRPQAALKAAMTKNWTPALPGIPSLPKDMSLAQTEQDFDTLPTLDVQGNRLVQDPTQTPDAIEQRNKRMEWEWGRDAAIAAAALKAKGDAEESEKERRNRIRIAEIQAGGRDTVKPPPAAVRREVSSHVAVRTLAKKALAALDANPSAVGFMKGVGMSPLAAEVTNRKFFGATDANVMTRNLLSDLSSIRVQERSGAAVPAAESWRFKGFTPEIGKDFQFNRRAIEEMIARADEGIAAANDEFSGFFAKHLSGSITPEQTLWDAAVQKHGEERVRREFGPRPQ